MRQFSNAYDQFKKIPSVWQKIKMMEIKMKNAENNNKKTGIKTRILAGVLAALMLASVVFGLISYLV